MDIGSLEGLVQSLYAKGIADSTRSAYSTAQHRYLTFCSNFGIAPLPLSEHTLCLFAAYLANQGLQARTISAYLSGLCYLQISSGLQAPAFSSWPWLHYVTRGIKRSQPPKDVRLPITLSVLKKLKQVWLGEESEPASYESRLLWAIACTAFFGFLRLGEVFPPAGNSTSPLLLSDLGTDSASSFEEQKTAPLERGPSSFWAEPTRTSAQASSQEVPHELSPRPGGPVPKSKWLPMLEGPFCPRSSPRPVKGRSQSLALCWTQLQNWSCHNCRRCRHSSPHDQEALHTVRPSIRQLPFTYFYCPRLYIRLLTCRPSCLPLGRHYFYFHFHTFYTIFTTFSAPSMGLITHLPFTHLTS